MGIEWFAIIATYPLRSVRKPLYVECFACTFLKLKRFRISCNQRIIPQLTRGETVPTIQCNRNWCSRPAVAKRRWSVKIFLAVHRKIRTLQCYFINLPAGTRLKSKRTKVLHYSTSPLFRCQLETSRVYRFVVRTPFEPNLYRKIRNECHTWKYL